MLKWCNIYSFDCFIASAVHLDKYRQITFSLKLMNKQSLTITLLDTVIQTIHYH